MQTLFSLIATYAASTRVRAADDEEGATMVEYGLLIALVALIAMLGLTPLGNALQGFFNDVSTNF